MKTKVTPKGNIQKVKAFMPGRLTSASIPGKKNPLSFKEEARSGNDNLAILKEATATVQQIKLAARHELELARKMRENARRYQQETATRARSDAQQLILRTRLSTQRETEELVRQASEEIQKVLADIRMIRIMAQEELAAQRKFTNAAKLRTMSLAIKDEDEKPENRKKKQPTST